MSAIRKKQGSAAAAGAKAAPKQHLFLDGQLLVAMPGMTDERFARSVIYLCAHSADGAMGIILNRPASVRNFPELLEQLRVIDSDERIKLPSAAKDIQVLFGGLVLNNPLPGMEFGQLLRQLNIVPEGTAVPDRQVMSGGPVESARGFVLHSADFHINNSTLPIDEGVSLTATIDILRAIAMGEGPDRALLALGYAGWGAGQLENEIQLNGWLHCPADPAIVFDRDLDTKYSRALRSIGIDLASLSVTAGHA